jgi:hypothetical protein
LPPRIPWAKERKIAWSYLDAMNDREIPKFAEVSLGIVPKYVADAKARFDVFAHTRIPVRRAVHFSPES